jgi:hypothetical protein
MLLSVLYFDKTQKLVNVAPWCSPEEKPGHSPARVFGKTEPAQTAGNFPKGFERYSLFFSMAIRDNTRSGKQPYIQTGVDWTMSAQPIF